MTDSLKRTVKYIIAVLFYYSGMLMLLSYLKRKMLGQPAYSILMYHRILDDEDNEKKYVQPGMYVTRPVFEKQAAFLSRKFNPISLGELAELLRTDQALHPKYVAVTFDDGWQDNYTHAFPGLKKNYIPATIFLTTDFINTDKIFWFAEIGMILAQSKITPERLSGILRKVVTDEEYASSFKYLDSGSVESGIINSDKFIGELKRFDLDTILKIIAELKGEIGVNFNERMSEGQMLTWKNVVEMNDNGMDFGSHGCSHRILTKLGREEIEKELTESKKIIEEKLGGEIDIFAYPNGDYDDRIKELVKDCGFVCAVTTGGTKEKALDNDIYSLKRINIHNGISVGPRGKFSAAMFSFHIFRNS
jgi:peptidoglycan/xylan/chitin deacetylase (PgdA/CDA1 family)